MIETYAEYGAVGVIVSLFVMMIVNLMKSQRAQNEDLDNIRQAIAKMESTIENVEGIVIKLIERWNKSDDISQRHREDIVKELNDVTDDLAYLKGRINGKASWQMVDSTKAVVNGVVGVGVWWVNLPMLLQMAVSIATLVYLIVKTNNEIRRK